MLKNGVPYRCIFGQERQWSKNMRNAAIKVLNDMRGGSDPLEEALE